MSKLVRYDAMCAAIAAAYEVDEVKDIRDKARALEVYSRQARNTEAERQACEIRLRAERRCGKLLREREMHGGDRRSRSDHATLKPLGVSKQQSSDWQQLAEVPEEDFEEHLAAADKPTTSGILAAHIAKPKNVVDDAALWLWGRLQDFERNGLLARDPTTMAQTMLPHMQETTRRLAPIVAAWLKEIT